MPPAEKKKIYKIDLTENNFTGMDDLRFLVEFPYLKTLILDKNRIKSNIHLPLMSCLQTLWLNHNQIENLVVFVQNIAEMCPNLKYLSMINNKAAPSYFNGGTLNEHNDYRMYVISKLRHLTMLDDKVVSDEERSQAQSLYGKIKKNRKNNKPAKQDKNRIELSNIEPSLQELQSLPDIDTNCQIENLNLDDLPSVTP